MITKSFSGSEKDSAARLDDARSSAASILFLLLHALVLWLLCGATMALGRAAFGIGTALIVHLFAAPVLAGLVSYHYFRRRDAARPLTAALAFLGFVAAGDAGIVAPVFEKSYIMFRSVIGIWLPFLLIFLSTFAVGTLLHRAKDRSASPD